MKHFPAFTKNKPIKDARRQSINNKDLAKELRQICYDSSKFKDNLKIKRKSTIFKWDIKKPLVKAPEAFRKSLPENLSTGDLDGWPSITMLNAKSDFVMDLCKQENIMDTIFKTQGTPRTNFEIPQLQKNKWLVSSKNLLKSKAAVEKKEVEAIYSKLLQRENLRSYYQPSQAEVSTLENDLKVLILKYRNITREYLITARELLDKEQYETCIMKIHSIIEISLTASDLDSLKKAHFLAGCVFVDKGNPREALLHYQYLRNIVEATKDNILKCHVYTEMGLCYQHLKEYKKAVRCFKKLLETSWKMEDKFQEARAFDYLGVQYFYLGNIEKSKYYHSRWLNGSYEPNTSNIRKVYSSISKRKFNYPITKESKLYFELESVESLYSDPSFIKLRTIILETPLLYTNTLKKTGTNKILPSVMKSPRARKKEAAGKASGLFRKLSLITKFVKHEKYKPVEKIYREAVLNKKAPLIRQQTPISQINDKDLPSPRGKTALELKNEEKEHQITVDFFKKHYKPINFNKILGGDFVSLSNKKTKKEKVFKNPKKSEVSLNEISKSIKIENIISKAKGKAKNTDSGITISHLSPVRGIRGDLTQVTPCESDQSTKKHTKSIMRRYTSMFLL
ncbi:unnamed protein product [Moneuplotes crassus]|uniref:Tetratricopeptide repeat protein 29 n=1 Tax=Euplotes crassus TaxID=5936 RepID=A0AAD2DCM1_EUPCR|nr:unnamed protein product [Moneuplotes crassus]